MSVIYIDMLLAVNLIIDYLLLCGTARVLSLSTTRWRLVLGAAIGALSALLILLPPMNAAWSLLYKLGTALIMVPIGFVIRRPAQFFKATLTLFMVSALFAGICHGLYILCSPTDILVQSGIVYWQLNPMLLLGITVLSYLLLCVYDRFTRLRAPHESSFRIDIGHNEICVSLHAMFDSGHRLRESFSGAPVIIVSRRVIGNGYDHLLTRYIPYASVGGRGVLPSFRPDKALLYVGDKTISINPVWIAVSDRLDNDTYDALIGPDLIPRL